MGWGKPKDEGGNGEVGATERSQLEGDRSVSLIPPNMDWHTLNKSNRQIESIIDDRPKFKVYNREYAELAELLRHSRRDERSVQ